MSSTSIRVTPTRTVTTRRTTWRRGEVRPEPAQTVRVWPYWVVSTAQAWRVPGRRRLETHLILGSAAQAGRLYRELSREGAGRVITPQSASEAHPIRPGLAVRCGELNEFAVRFGVTRIVVADPDFSRRSALAGALMDCKLRGMEIHEPSQSCETISRKIWLKGFRPDLVVFAGHFRRSRLYMAAKRAIDMALSVTIAILAAPLLLVAAAAIKAESPGPVFFRQERVGLHGRRFRVCKFRTMRQDAETGTGPVWASIQDGRITRVGRWLRRYRIDEVPQIFNVLAGDMSLVGPRPERPHFVEILRQHISFYDLRHYVKPGITGWAQVMYAYGASVEDAYEKLQYDLYYLKHMSLSADLTILARTVLVVFQGRGR